MTTQTFAVDGMTCGHCVRAVTEEVTKLAGVRAVSVDLSSGAVTVDSDVALERAAVVAAIDEAGYRVVS